MNKIELLAPAGSIESLYAAVNAGTDAVYLGGSKFSARAYATNFTTEDLEKAIDYCHGFGVKVYITLNTLIKQNEFKEAIEYINLLYKIGVDGIIIQDTGLAYVLSKYFKALEIHASTQMSIHNGEGALFLKESGFKRIVLSRELSLEEIKYISKDLGIETEIFVHGALCVCYSGQCLMSSLIGGRSGNRGRCAQPCRLPYTIINEKDNSKKQGYLLSPKDLCTIDNVQDLINTGTSSLKIEGRMKRAEYVAGVVESYKKAINLALENKNPSMDKEKRRLLQLFNREGFSRAYLYGNEGSSMMAYNNPKNSGVVLGRVNKDFTIVLQEDLAVGDGIRATTENGFTLSKISKDNKEVSEGKAGDKVKLYPVRFKPGDIIYKTLDNNLMKNYEGFYKNPYGRKIPLTIGMEFSLGKPLNISCNYEGKIYELQGDIVEKPINKPLQQSKVEENLKKQGDYPYKIEEVIFSSYEEGYVPISSINSLRRRLIETIVEDRIIASKKPLPVIDIEKVTPEKKDIPNLIVTLSTKEQLKAAEELNIENIVISPFYRNKEHLSIKDLKDYKSRYFIKTPTILKEKDFNFVCNFIEENLQNIKGILTSNLGLIRKFKNRVNIIGDYKLNIFNSFSLEFFKDLWVSCISLELNHREIKEVALKNNNFQILLYGRPELMISEYCAIGSAVGGKSSNTECNRECERDNYKLVDRMNESFLLRTDIFCRGYVYNNVPINLIKEKQDMMKLGVNSFRIDLIDESYEKTLEILRSFIEGKGDPVPNSYTKGHYKRGVE